jgi:phage gpG-like protein
MAAKISAEIKGLKETQRAMEKAVQDLRGTPLTNAMRDATLLVTRDAKSNLVGYESPSIGGVNTGRLRASITPEVRSGTDTVQGIVGSNVSYAPFVEFDTRPHWPPIAALKVWAERHHANAFLVARAISRRGTIGKHYLQKAFDTNRGKIEARFQKAVDQIVRDANK